MEGRLLESAEFEKDVGGAYQSQARHAAGLLHGVPHQSSACEAQAGQ